MKFRIGLGFDVHQLETGRDFWLGGIKLPAEKGAVGHSDADVLIHAICDALLGAANLRDIGFHYSNNDPKWKGKDSKFFLKDVTQMLHEKGWQIENVDCTLCLEKPKINPHISEMKKVLAPLMNMSERSLDALDYTLLLHHRLNKNPMHLSNLNGRDYVSLNNG